MKKPENSVEPGTRAAWRAWLMTHHTRNEGVWVIVEKKKREAAGALSFDDVIEEALCFGWIDSKPGKLDETHAMRWCSPRRPGANWSKLNKERVERLTAAGKMTAAGLAVVDRSKRDGTWTALDGVERLEVPTDLKQEFGKYRHAEGYFEAFPRSVKRAILEWIGNAKRPETRANRVKETARLANENVRANQWRQ